MNDMQLGNRSLVGKDYSNAITHFLKHAASHPVDAADAFASIAECYRRSNVLARPIQIDDEITLVSKGDLQSAEYYYRLALQSEPNHIKSLRGLADILPDKSEERLDFLERAVQTQPGTLTLIDLGDFYRSHRKDYNRAYELYCDAQQHAPRVETAYRRLNDICRKLDRPDEAKGWSERWREARKTKRRVGLPAN